MKEFQNTCARLVLIILLNTSEQMFPNNSATSDITVKIWHLNFVKNNFPQLRLGKLLQNQLKWSNQVIYQEHLFRKVFSNQSSSAWCPLKGHTYLNKSAAERLANRSSIGNAKYSVVSFQFSVYNYFDFYKSFIK